MFLINAKKFRKQVSCVLCFVLWIDIFGCTLYDFDKKYYLLVMHCCLRDLFSRISPAEFLLAALGPCGVARTSNS